MKRFFCAESSEAIVRRMVVLLKHESVSNSIISGQNLVESE